MKKQFSLKWKILIIFFGISAVMLSGVLFISSFLNAKTIRDSSKYFLSEKTTEIKETLELYFNEREMQLSAMAKDPIVQRYLLTGEDQEDVVAKFEVQVSEYADTDTWFITGDDGVIILDSVDGKSVGMDAKTHAMWKWVKSTNEYFVDNTIIKSDVNNNLILLVAKRIDDKNGNFIGVIGFSIYWDKFLDKFILNNEAGAGRSFAIFDSAMRIIAHTDKKMILMDLSDAKDAQDILNSDQGFKRSYDEINKNWILLSFDTFKKTGWKIMATTDENEILAAIKQRRNIILGLGVLIFLIGAIFTFIFIDKISKVIQSITNRANNFAVGNFEVDEVTLKVFDKMASRNDELGATGQAMGRLVGYLREKVELSEKIADGDLRVNVTISSEEDKLGKSLEKMVVSLNDMIAQVNGAVDQVTSGSNQVAQSSQELSQGAAEQASSLEEITSSITEINSQSKQNSDNAISASGLAKQSMESAESGNTQMKDLVLAMDEINKSSDEIKRIVKVIDDIAFQTNLLALNANVEAARAGKYGKGFAVVAEEVRNLATRSAESVKETTEMVEKNIKNIASGNNLVEATAKQLEEIMIGANKAADLVEEIATASKEQTMGLDQINQGLGQIDQVTQSNTASAEESASAAEELAGQAQHLKAIVAKFKLKNTNSKIQENNSKYSNELMDKLQKEIKAEYNQEKNGINKNRWNSLQKDPKEIIKLDDDDFDKF